MKGYRRGSRPVYKSMIDGFVMFVAVALVLAAIKYFGLIDLGTGTLQVVDGDSLRRGDLDIRLHGIDAPEYRQTCRDKHGSEYSCGKQATNALRGLVGKQEVSCTSIETDRYGRAVAVCRIGGLEINGEMVRLGWAIAYTRHSLTYVRLEAEARLAKRGIWAGSFEPPEDYRARLHLVQGNLGDAPPPD